VKSGIVDWYRGSGQETEPKWRQIIKKRPNPTDTELIVCGDDDYSKIIN